MKTRLFFVMVLGASLTMLVTPGAAAPPPETPEPPDGSTPQYPLGQEFDEPLAKEYPFDLKDAVGQSIASVNPQGERIDIAVTGDDEMDPSVALCAYDQYLIAYVLDGEIYGQRLTSGGDLLGGPFLISGDSYEDTQPDVACEWAYNRFVVVWRHNFGDSGDYDIRARGVYGGHQTSGSQLYGSELTVSDDEANEERPAIACNINEHTCLVAFEYSGTGSGDIYAQRVSVGGSDISKDGDRFTISTYAAEEHNPDVAWGGHDDNYLVAWQYLHDDPSSHYRIVVSHVYDTEQGTGTEERQHVGAWLINPDEGSNRHQSVPAVAYSRDDQNYLVAFQYDYSGDGSDYDIRARRYAGTGATTASGLIYVASSFDNESSPAVAYSGGPEDLPGMGSDQFLVTYVHAGSTATEVRGRPIKGTHDASGNQLDGDSVQIRTTGSGFNYGIFGPDVTGSVNNGHYLVVWEDMIGGFAGYDYDVLGQMLSSGASVYLPLILDGYPSVFDFRLNPDGYSFRNYGNSSHTYQDDLGAGDLINMFGSGTVCASGSTPADCVLTSAAEAWRQQMFTWMNGGHCEGMAVTSLRFFKGQTYYTGDTTPGDFQTGAQAVYDLGRSQAIDNYIAYYFALQDVEEVWQPTEFIRHNSTPKQQLEMVLQELQSGKDPYSLNIYDPALTVGHAIVPYDIEDRGGGIYRLYVYDNNDPGDDSLYITFDTNNDTWTYDSTFWGNASTKSLSLSRISLRTGEPFTAPFAANGSAVEFFTTNGGDLLITNSRGQRIGYDPATGQMVNEIPEAHVVYLRGVSGPKYWIPLGKVDGPYRVTVSGENISAQVDTNLVMVGPGYVVGFEDIPLRPSQALRMSLSADGRELAFEEGQLEQAPRMFQAIDGVER